MFMVLPLLDVLLPEEDRSCWLNARLGGPDTRTLVRKHREHLSFLWPPG